MSDLLNNWRYLYGKEMPKMEFDIIELAFMVPAIRAQADKSNAYSKGLVEEDEYKAECVKHAEAWEEIANRIETQLKEWSKK